MDEKAVEVSTLTGIQDSTLPDVAAELGEIVLDRFMEEGLLKDIPLLGTMVKVASTIRSISNLLFLKKVHRFLTRLDEISQRERITFAAKLDADGQERARVGENLFLLLERLNDMRKPDMLGKACSAYVRGELSFRQMQVLNAAIDRLDIPYLGDLADFYGGPSDSYAPETEALQHLAYCGLATVFFGSGAALRGKRGGYQQNEIGKLFVKIIMADA